MKKTVIVVLFVTLFASCKKEPPMLTNAVITGPDRGYCICCGGLMISFTGETQPYTGSYRHIQNVTNLGLTPQDTFPLHVKVAWQEDTTNACHFIVITKLEK